MIEADPKTQETQSLTFSQAINSCYRKTLTLRGCTSRGEYWRFFLFFIVFFLGIPVLLPLDLFELAETLWVLGGTVTNLALNTATVRRLHDIGRSGWWFWIWPISGTMFLLPFVDSRFDWLLVAPGILGIVLMIQWLAMPGIDTANNKYAKEEEEEKEKEKEIAKLGSWKE